jgi:hypothetical protein
LSLDRLTTLSPEAAGALAQYNGCLYLRGLKELSDEVAIALSQHDGDLVLKGQTSRKINAAKASSKAAKASAQHKRGLVALETAMAGPHIGDLYLNDLTGLTSEQAKALSQHNGTLYLNGLTGLTSEQAKALAEHKGSLYLNGLRLLSREAAKALSQHEGYLALSEDMVSRVRQGKRDAWLEEGKAKVGPWQKKFDLQCPKHGYLTWSGTQVSNTRCSQCNNQSGSGSFNCDLFVTCTAVAMIRVTEWPDGTKSFEFKALD